MAINEEAAIKAILKANGITGPLVPLAIKILREQFDSGEAFGADFLGPFTPAINPVGTAAAILGQQAKKTRSKKQKAQDKKKSEAWAEANEFMRKDNGQLRKGKTQKDVATRANKNLRKGTTKGEVRKTARRAFER